MDKYESCKEKESGPNDLATLPEFGERSSKISLLQQIVIQVIIFRSCSLLSKIALPPTEENSPCDQF